MGCPEDPETYLSGAYVRACRPLLTLSRPELKCISDGPVVRRPHSSSPRLRINPRTRLDAEPTTPLFGSFQGGEEGFAAVAAPSGGGERVGPSIQGSEGKSLKVAGGDRGPCMPGCSTLLDHMHRTSSESFPLFFFPHPRHPFSM